MSKGLQKSGKELRVVTLEAQEAIWRLAPRDWIGKRKAAIATVARLLGWPFSRTWNIAHGRARRIDAHEMDRLRVMLGRVELLKEQANANQSRLNDVIFARHEIARIGQAHREGEPGAGSVPEARGESGQASGGVGPRAAAKTATRG